MHYNENVHNVMFSDGAGNKTETKHRTMKFSFIDRTRDPAPKPITKIFQRLLRTTTVPVLILIIYLPAGQNLY